VINFYRWFSGAKIFFFTPLKHLVVQQAESLRQHLRETHVPGFLDSRVISDQIFEITADVSKPKRQAAYQQGRIFFACPQIVYNDLTKYNILETEDICLAIFDEVHKATPNYAYSLIVTELYKSPLRNPRILALTATPGTSDAAFQQILKTVKISNIEERTAKDPSLQKYINRIDEFSVGINRPDLKKTINEYCSNIITYLFQTLQTLMRRDTDA
jgi:ERCC4-related helicase